jgi:hypothetical protein
MSKKLLVCLLLTLILAASSEILFSSGGLAPRSSGTSTPGGEQDDGAYSVIKTYDEGLAIAGYTKSYGEGGSDFWLLRFAPINITKDGKPWTVNFQEEQWSKTYGGPLDEVAKSVIETADGGFAMAGYANSSTTGLDMLLVKTDLNGVMEWSSALGGLQDEMANSVIQTEDGGYLLAGCIDFDAQSQSTYVTKTDSLGNIQWNRTLPGQGANSIIDCGDGGYALVVKSPNVFGLVKINASGETQLSMDYMGPADEAEAQSIINTDDGGFAIAGWIGTNGTRERGTWLIKTDSSGILEWSRTYQGFGAYSLIKTSDGNYAMTGDSAYLMVTDSAGNVLMTKRYGDEPSEDGKYFSTGYSLAEITPNHLDIVGVTINSVENNYDIIWANIALRTTTDSTAPTIIILSPENNKTYPSDDVPLTFYVSEPLLYLWYSLDGYNATLPGNTTLPTLTDGVHSITVYATDEDYNIGTSEPVYFSSETIYFTTTAALTIAPPDNTSPTDDEQKDSTENQLQTVLTATAIATITVFAAATTIYYIRHQKISKRTN